MNQFRDITMFALIAIGISFLITEPENWNWISMCGGYVVSGVQFMATIRPFGTIICMVLALALFMTRIKY
jgi:uncharacterized membrane protein YkgB